jgi:hypothetical protein
MSLVWSKQVYLKNTLESHSREVSYDPFTSLLLSLLLTLVILRDFEFRTSYPSKDEASTSISRPSFPRRCTSDNGMSPSQSKCVESRTRP